MGTKSALGNKRQLTNQIAGKDASLFSLFFWKTQSSLKQRHRWMYGIHICYPTRWICYKIWYLKYSYKGAYQTCQKHNFQHICAEKISCESLKKIRLIGFF